MRQRNHCYYSKYLASRIFTVFGLFLIPFSSTPPPNYEQKVNQKLIKENLFLNWKQLENHLKRLTLLECPLGSAFKVFEKLKFNQLYSVFTPVFSDNQCYVQVPARAFLLFRNVTANCWLTILDVAFFGIDLSKAP